MAPNFSKTLTIVIMLSVIVEIIPIQLQEGEVKENVEGSQLNQCLSVSGRSEVGVCFGKELLNKLSDYDETDTFSLASGVSFVRDEKGRSIGNFLEKDPMDFRSMMEDASSLISKRALHWDLGVVYPGLILRIGPTLANGVLEFVIDPRIKDRSYHNSGEMSTGRLLTRNLLVPFLLGLKFHISTLLPLLLGIVLIASKKAFFLAKLAFLAVTLFSGSSYSGQYGNGFNNFGSYIFPSHSSYHSHDNHGSYSHYGHHGHHDHHSSGGNHDNRYPYSGDYYYKEQTSEHTTASPITPDELRERFERLFVTKKDTNDSREDKKVRNGRDFAWTPINGR